MNNDSISSSKLRDFIRFGVVGALCTVIDLSLLTLLLHSHVVKFLAVLIGYLSGSVVGYLLNNNWTYKHLGHKNSLAGLIKFASIAFVGLGLTEGIIFLLTTYQSWTVLYAKLLATVVVFFWNFYANRHFTFRIHGSVSEENDL